MEAENKVQPMLEAATTKKVVERSTIEFPYLDQENAFEISEGVHAIGGSGCDWDQLAAHFKQAAQGGGFRLRLITAKAFGLVTYDRGRIALTSLGLRSVDPVQQQAAKVDSFLTVPLYKAVYDKFRGGSLPPTAGLEREMVTLGVAKKQADKARQTFQRSAKFAGFFEFGADRLVAPSVNNQAQSAPGQDHQHESGNNNPHGSVGGGGGGNVYHPFIVGLLQKLPDPDSDWSAKERTKWLQTAANIFDLMYTGGNDGEIEVSFTPAKGANP